jgi:hypothetical protein
VEQRLLVRPAMAENEHSSERCTVITGAQQEE